MPTFGGQPWVRAPAGCSEQSWGRTEHRTTTPLWTRIRSLSLGPGRERLETLGIPLAMGRLCYANEDTHCQPLLTLVLGWGLVTGKITTGPDPEMGALTPPDFRRGGEGPASDVTDQVFLLRDPTKDSAQGGEGSFLLGELWLPGGR